MILTPAASIFINNTNQATHSMTTASETEITTQPLTTAKAENSKEKRGEIQTTEQGLLKLWIEQAHYVELGVETKIDFGIYNGYDGNHNVSIDLFLYCPNGTISGIYREPQVKLESKNSFDYYGLLLYLHEVGYYFVRLQVYDFNTLEWWYAYCWFYVYSLDVPEKFDLLISQENYVAVNKSTTIDFDFYNDYGAPRNVTVIVQLTDPAGSTYDVYYKDNFEVGDYFQSSVDVLLNRAGYYNVTMLVIDHETGLSWIAFCWYYVIDVSDVLAIWIEQENEIMVDQLTTLYFYIENFYTGTHPVEIWLNITGPSGEKNYYFSSANILDNETFWDSVDLQFNDTGHYTVKLGVIDRITGLWWFAGCWYEVMETKQELNVWLEQENHVLVDKATLVTIHIYNGYTTEHLCNISVVLHNKEDNTDNEIYSSRELIGPDIEFQDNVTVVFDKKGSYEVKLIVHDLITDLWWHDWCWFEVYVDGWLEPWLKQENYVPVGQETTIDINILNAYPDIHECDVELWIHNPNMGESWTEFSGRISIDSQYTWVHSVNLTFSDPDAYDVELKVFDLTVQREWHDWCWFVIYDQEELLLSIYQKFHISVGETTNIDFSIDNLYYSMHECYVEVWITHPDGTNQSIYGDQVKIESFDRFWEHLEYTFDKIGHYDVTLRVYDYGTLQKWFTYCWFEVKEETTDFVLWIDQEYEVKVDQETWIKFGFNNDMLEIFDGKVELEVVGPTSQWIAYQEEIYLENFGDFSKEITIQFNATGYYEIIWRVNNHLGGEVWEEKCWFDVYPRDNITIEQPESVTIYEGETVNLKWIATLAEGWAPYGYTINHNAQVVRSGDYNSSEPVYYSETIMTTGTYSYTAVFKAINQTTATAQGEVIEASCTIRVIVKSPTEPPTAEIVIEQPEEIVIREGDTETLKWQAFIPENYTEAGYKIFRDGTKVDSGDYDHGFPVEYKISNLAEGTYKYTAEFKAEDPTTGKIISKSCTITVIVKAAEPGTESEEPSGGSVTPPPAIPGFELVFALAALLVLIPMIRRKRN